MSAEELLARECYTVACQGIIAVEPEAARRTRKFDELTASGRAGWIALAKHLIATRPETKGPRP